MNASSHDRAPNSGLLLTALAVVLSGCGSAAATDCSAPEGWQYFDSTISSVTLLITILVAYLGIRRHQDYRQIETANARFHLHSSLIADANFTDWVILLESSDARSEPLVEKAIKTRRQSFRKFLYSLNLLAGMIQDGQTPARFEADVHHTFALVAHSNAILAYINRLLATSRGKGVDSLSETGGLPNFLNYMARKHPDWLPLSS